MNNQNQKQIMGYIFEKPPPSRNLIDFSSPVKPKLRVRVDFEGIRSNWHSQEKKGLQETIHEYVLNLLGRIGFREIVVVGADTDSMFLSCKRVLFFQKNTVDALNGTTLDLMSNPTLASFAFCKKNVSGNSPTNNTYNDIYVSHDSFHANGNPYILLELCIVNRKRPPDDRLCFWIYNYKDPPVIFIHYISFFFFFFFFAFFFDFYYFFFFVNMCSSFF